MQFHLLASGSKGNCFVLFHENEMIVIDCGSTKRHLTHSFHSINLDYKRVKGLLLTHEHSDHTSQLKMFQGQQVYAPFPLTNEYQGQIVVPYEEFCIGHFRVFPLALSHDTNLTVGYVIHNGKEKLVYITDTGYVRNEDHKWIENADYYIIESNHDVPMLMKTRRPYPIKQRILSAIGHLSNEDCADLLLEVIGDKTKEIVLAHISEEANSYEKAWNVCVKTLQKDAIKIRCAKQFEILTGGYCDEQENN